MIGGKKLILKQMTDKVKIHRTGILLVFAFGFILSACEDTVEPSPESYVGFWKAEEISQHFWLDENIDSLTGFGQIARVNSSGFVEWIQTDVSGNVVGTDVSLTISFSNTTTIFEGQIISDDKFIGFWIAEGDTINVTYNKRTRD